MIAGSFFSSHTGQVILWSGGTIVPYLIAKRAYLRWKRIWFLPIAITPLLLILLVLALHETYQRYIHGAGWLIALLGPTTIAFAVPIYERRRLIIEQWPVLCIGVAIGTATAVLTSYGLASLLRIDKLLRLSLLPRSLSTPFAIVVSDRIGGIPALTTLFVVVTGLVGAILGDAMITVLPVRSAIARGALLGISAHGAGTAKAYELGHEEGTMAGLVMILSGLFNVALAPLLSVCLR